MEDDEIRVIPEKHWRDETPKETESYHQGYRRGYRDAFDGFVLKRVKRDVNFFTVSEKFKRGYIKGYLSAKNIQGRQPRKEVNQ